MAVRVHIWVGVNAKVGVLLRVGEKLGERVGLGVKVSEGIFVRVVVCVKETVTLGVKLDVKAIV